MKDEIRNQDPEGYWHCRGTYEALADALQAKLPQQGPCPTTTPKLERLRRAIKAYYDLYNDGGLNCLGDIRTLLGASSRSCWSSNPVTSNRARLKVEAAIDNLVLEAAQEWLWQEFMSPTGDITQIRRVVGVRR